VLKIRCAIRSVVSSNSGFLAIMPDTPSKAQLRREIYAAIGEAITAWGAVEDAMLKILWQLLGCRIAQAGIVWHSFVSFTAKLEMMDSLFAEGYSGHKVQAYWPSLNEYARMLSGKRNQIAHRELFISAALFPHAWDRTKKASAQTTKRPSYAADEINFAAREFWYLGSEAKGLYLALGGRIPWPDKFDQPIVRLQMSDGAMPPNRDKPQAPPQSSGV
jgi:hypothetical protein